MNSSSLSVALYLEDKFPRPANTSLPVVAGESWWGTFNDPSPDRVPFATSVISTDWMFPAPTLLVSDVDSTLIDEEVIDQLADLAGVGSQVAEITERAMQGELDFEQSLIARVQQLAGLPFEAFAEVFSGLHIRSGAQTLIDWVHATGGKVAVVSGGFVPIVDMLAQRLQIDYSLANDLEVVDGKLTGRVRGAVVTSEGKLAFLRALEQKTGFRSVALGDGANDIPMMQGAGMGIAVCAKPRAREAVPNHLDLPLWDAVIGLMGHNATI